MDVTSDSLREQLIALGINTQNKAFRRREAAARAAAIQRYQETSNANDKNRDPSAITARKIINAGLNWASTVVSGLIMVFGLILALGVVIAVEIAAVESGLRATQTEFTILYAIGLVFIYLVLAFYLEAVKRSSGEEPNEIFSLRSFFQNIKYFLGIGRWSVRYKRPHSEVQAVKAVMNMTLGAIVFFGVLGRVPHLIQHVEGPWYYALIFLVTQSTLSDMVIIVGTLFAMFAALLGTRKIVAAMYLRFHTLTGGIDNDQSFLSVYSVDDLIEEELQRLYKEILIQHQELNRLPDRVLTPTQNVKLEDNTQ